MSSFAIDLRSAKSSEARAELIESYPVPNSKEDIIEFMILASSNLDKILSGIEYEAWIAKFEQCYQKASLTLDGDKDFPKIQALYSQTKEEAERRTPARYVGLFASVFPNPIVAVTGALLLLWEAARILTGRFAAIDILCCLFILWLSNKVSKKLRNDDVAEDKGGEGGGRVD